MLPMILVTGSTGFIGRSLCDALNQQELPFRAYSGRIDDLKALRAELVDVDTVIHLASAESHDRVRLLQQVDVHGTELLLDECRQADVARIIAVSRLNADPASMYALLRAKGEMERHIIRGGIPYTIIRSATLFGRDDRFLTDDQIPIGINFPFQASIHSDRALVPDRSFKCDFFPHKGNDIVRFFMIV